MLFEYSGRGINGLTQQPIFFMFIFGIYFSFFAMLEDLMVRHKLTNFQVFLIAVSWGTLVEAFVTGNLYDPDASFGITLVGVNIVNFIIISVFAWGIVQSNITLYLANRLQPRDWDHPKMGTLGWIVCILYQIGIVLVAMQSPVTPKSQLAGYIALLIFEAAMLTILVYSLKNPREDKPKFSPVPLMDFLAFGSVVIFLILGTFFVDWKAVVTQHSLNRTAIVLEVIWTIIAGVTFIIYRMVSRKEIAV
ncbi:MAG: hypothetical protein H8E29_16165 [Anaerolineales bacterium]|uniref:Uncharacterized protein n=1 Tax=Candidatus Desulfolinea nitratireducens TaxID=2841698 RepID=A0A8J6NPF8_9CHLR|nr:hypothetical protein [Candidatus Desulfolinea nitratireducens]